MSKIVVFNFGRWSLCIITMMVDEGQTTFDAEMQLIPNID